MADEPQISVLGHLQFAYMKMRLIKASLVDVRISLSNARELAVEQKRPTSQILSLQHDLDALEELIGDQITDLLRKLAEVETGSRG